MLWIWFEKLIQNAQLNFNALIQMEFKFVQVRSDPSLLRPNHDLKRPHKAFVVGLSIILIQ